MEKRVGLDDDGLAGKVEHTGDMIAGVAWGE